MYVLQYVKYIRILRPVDIRTSLIAIVVFLDCFYQCSRCDVDLEELLLVTIYTKKTFRLRYTYTQLEGRSTKNLKEKQWLGLAWKASYPSLPSPGMAILGFPADSGKYNVK